MDCDNLVAGRLASNDLQRSAGTVDKAGQKLHKCLICSRINGRSGDFDFQFSTQNFANLIAQSARLYLYV